MADNATRTFGKSEHGLPVEQALLLEQACDRFEAKWRAGERPDLAVAIRDLPEAIRPAARIRRDRGDYRNRSGEDPVPSDYPDLDPEWLAGLTATFDRLTVLDFAAQQEMYFITVRNTLYIPRSAVAHVSRSRRG